MKMGMTFKALCLLGTVLLPAPFAAADNIADCEVLIAERIEDEGTGGSALISSYRPAAEFISSVYDDEDGHIREIDGHKIQALLCQRRSAVPTLRDYPLLETGIALTLSQNFDSAISDVVIVKFKDGAFRAVYTGPGLSDAAQSELDDVIEVFNLQPNDLAAREAKQKTAEGSKARAIETVSVSPEPKPELKPEPEPEPAPEVVLEPNLDPSSVVLPSPVEAVLDLPENNIAAEPIEIITIAPDKAAAAVPLETEITPKSELVVQQAALPKDAEGPQLEADTPKTDLCRIVARDALGQLQEVPISAKGLKDSLDASPIFVFPTPPGLNLRAVKCLRSTLTPGENDYKVARAGYPFFYQVDGDNKRVAALEFIGGKFRMNLVEGDFTAQELIDAKARILAFNDQHLKDLEKQRKGAP